VKLIAAPIVYVAWAAIVIVALVGTYPADPYVFEFTTLGLAWVTGAIALLGLAVCVWSGALARRGRVVILASMIAAAAAVGVALPVSSGHDDSDVCEIRCDPCSCSRRAARPITSCPM
jgi:hypothetical protein